MVRGILRLMAVLVMAVGLVGATGSFHLRLVKSEPLADAVVPAPETIQLWYSEAPALKLTTVKLTGPDGTVKDLEPAVAGEEGKHLTAPVTGLAAGAYSLAWRTQSKDGHVVSGNFAFTVQAQD